MDQTPAKAQAQAVEGDEDEWELQNEDGFVYKCRKRRRCVGGNSAAAAPAISIGDLEVEDRNRRARKRRILVNLMKTYRREMDMWEILSKDLQDVREKAVRLPTEKEDETASLLVPASAVVRETEKDGCGGESLLDELFMLAESQEEVIRKLSSCCDIAEAVCNAETERLKQHCFDLPIWGSPCELMGSLSSEDLSYRTSPTNCAS